MPGLFSTFNIATRGMSVQQKAIEVTSHNIANANTKGYSRQRATMETTKPFGMAGMNSVREPGQLGTGVQVSAIDRYRDAFLDYQTRVETSTLGQFEAREKMLGEIESIFNEPSDTGISTVLGKFFDAWQQLSKQPQSSNARTVVAQQSAALADDLNHAYTQLIKLKENVQAQIKNAIVDANSKLNQIEQINKQIIGVTVAGNRANDLMDKRDLLVDELSSAFNINIETKPFDGINIKPVDTNGVLDSYVVQAEDNGNTRRLSYISSIVKDEPLNPADTNYTITYYKNGDMSKEQNKVVLSVSNIDAKTFKTLDETRVLWSNIDGVAIAADGNLLDGNALVDASEMAQFMPSDGELKGFMSVQANIDDYVDQLNKLAKALAYSVNAVHSGQADGSNDSIPFFVNKDVASYGTGNILTNITDTTDEEGHITAGNISVNKELLSNVMKIKTRTNDDLFTYAADNDVDGETDGERALAIGRLRDNLMLIQSVDAETDRKTFIGTSLSNHGMSIENNVNGMKMDNYFKDTIDKLGIESQEAKRMVKNQNALLANFDDSRTSISGVSLDEEMANLVQFQHAYQANAKIVSTVDELLDVVINGLKR